MERVLYFCSEGDSVLVGQVMRGLEATRAAALPAPLLAALQRTFLSCAVSDEETLETMRRVHAESGSYLLDPSLPPRQHAAPPARETPF